MLDRARRDAASTQSGPAREDMPLVIMLGLRGCPDIQGGIERHVEELAPRLVMGGCRIEVVARASYLAPDAPRVWRGVTIVPLWCLRQKALEAVLHTAAGVVYAARRRPDILHVHAVGPSLLVPLARLLGLRVVVTHHGFDYERAKWGVLAKTLLRGGEWAGMRFATARIAVSDAVAISVRQRFGVRIDAVPNGVTGREPPATEAALQRFALDPQRYLAVVARLVPEKRQDDLLEAFARARPPGWKLAVIGGAEFEDSYVADLRRRAAQVPDVVLTGFQSGLALQELLAHAGLFVLPSSHEGLPIALLEALSYGLPALASDIPANREVGLSADRYFPVGDIDRLAALITAECRSPQSPDARAAARARIMRDYDWDVIALRTLEVYRSVLPQPLAATGRMSALGAAASRKE